MKRKVFIEYYTPCTEIQRTKIEVLRNKRRLRNYYRKLVRPNLEELSQILSTLD